MVVKKKAAKKPAVKKPKVKKEKLLGKIAHYFDKISVAAINVKAPIKVGDVLHIKGHTTDFDQPVDSMQIEHVAVEKAKKGDDIGIKVSQYVREGDGVFLKAK
jgi:putative protease